MRDIDFQSRFKDALIARLFTGVVELIRDSRRELNYS